MPRKLLFAALPLLLAAPAHAEDLQVTTTVGFESRYLFRGVQFAETSLQPAINLSYGNFYGSAWFNLPIGDDDLVITPGGEEMDLIAGYSAALNDSISFDVGVIYYAFPDASSGLFSFNKEDGTPEGSDTLEPYVGLSFTAPLSPSIYVYHDVFLDTVTVQGNISHTVALDGPWSVSLSGYVGYVVDDAGGTDYLYGTGSANLNYAFSDHGSFYVGARFGGSDIAGGSVIDDSISATTKSNTAWWGLGFQATL